MNLRNEIEKAIDALEKMPMPSGDHWLSMKDVKAAIFALPGFAAVELKDWPDAEGWWSRNGVVVRAVQVLYSQGNGFCIMLPGDDHYQYKNSTTLQGNWLPATLLIPPAKPVEPKMTQEAWLVVDYTGKPVHVSACHAWAVDRMEAWNRNASAATVPARVVRIPPQPMETR